MELDGLTAATAAQRLAAGDVSVVDLVEAAPNRINTVEAAGKRRWAGRPRLARLRGSASGLACRRRL